MNIFVLILLLSILDAPVVEPDARALRRHNTAKAIARKRRVGRSEIGAILWFDEPETTYAHTWMPKPEWEGLYVDSPNLRPAKIYSKPQQNRWDTFEWKQRSYMYNGRVHVGDRKRKGKRKYKGELMEKLRFQQLMGDYEQYGE